MSDLLIIYDPEKEVGAIIDTDTYVAYGPTMVGPQAAQLLQRFVDSLPFSLDSLSTYERAAAFSQFLERTGMVPTQEATTGGDSKVEPEGTATVDTSTRAAEAEAHAAGTVPAEQPADTTPPEAENPQTKQITCGNCNGTGTTNDGPDGTTRQCGMCQGSGRVTVPAQ